MSPAENPLGPAIHPAHGHAHHPHAHGAPATALLHTRPAHRPLTLLTSGLGLRLGAAAALIALLWAVVLWALV
jgi:hypothetical protein